LRIPSDEALTLQQECASAFSTKSTQPRLMLMLAM
jgi:hypothetical protein